MCVLKLRIKSKMGRKTGIIYFLSFAISFTRAQIRYPLLNAFNSLLNTPSDPSEGFVRDASKFHSTYDFIIVGSGSGGSVVANRLTENPAWKVLLLEAGRDENFITEIPLTASLLQSTDYNWGYKAERQKKGCLSLQSGVCNFPAGKAVGGTSVINYMLYARGNQNDFDEWEKMGNTNWGFQKVLPYFIKSERASKNLQNIDVDYHGFDGFLNVEHSPFQTDLVQKFLETAQWFNSTARDINGRIPTGFSRVQANLRSGRRCSASKAFLRPIRSRQNFHLSKQSRVTKLLMDPEGRQTIGVEFLKRGRYFRIRASKEVILSAGAFNSPQLLLLSGIGPQEHLQQLNIPVVKNLSVGLNLQDHISLPGLAFLLNESVSLTSSHFFNPLAIYDNIAHQRGPFTIPGGAEAYAFVKTKLNDVSGNYPDLELALASSAINNDATGVIRNLLGLTQEFYDGLYDGIKGRDAFSIVPVLLKPKSRGRIMIRSKNPFHSPLIYLNYFSDERDLDTLLEGIKMAISVGESEPFRRFGSYLNPRPYPGCGHYLFGSDHYWRCALQRFTSSLYHPVGTCKMGPQSDPDAVVDPELKVHGVKSLRVVDGSVMPTIVAGHTNAAIFMIGEKASDMIKETWIKKVLL